MTLEIAFEIGRISIPVTGANGSFAFLSALLDFWSTGSIDGSGRPVGLYANTLLVGGTPVYNSINNGVPYAAFDGVGDYFYQWPGSTFDITGTETYIHSDMRGLTLGGWFYHTSLTGAQVYMSKYGNSGERGYVLRKDLGHTARFMVSDDGTSEGAVVGGMVPNETWVFIVGRFVTASGMALFQNEVKVALPLVIPYIFDATADFRVGAADGTSNYFLSGRASRFFICAAALPDASIEALFQASRGLFGV